MNERNMEELAAVSWDAKMLLERLRRLDLMIDNDLQPDGLRASLAGVLESVAGFVYTSEWALDSDLMVD